MTESAARSAPESRDVPRESEAPRSAQIDSNQYQSGENLRASSSVDNTKNLGFANTSIDGANSNDTKYSPASAMSAQDKSDKLGQAPRNDEQAAKPAEQAPKTSEQAAKPQEPVPATAEQAPKAPEQAPTTPDQAQKAPEQAPTTPDQAPKSPEQTPPAEEAESQSTRSAVIFPEKDRLPETKTEIKDDGSSSTTNFDNSTNSHTIVGRDSNGNISSITNNAMSDANRVTTSYSPDGKPTSQETSDGKVTYDENGKITSDTRNNPSDRPTPQALQTTKNPDGTTTYDAPNSDGTHQSFTFRDDKSLARTVQKTADGTTRENDFYQNGSIKEQHLSNSTRFADANEMTNTWDQNGVQRSTETKNHQGWERAEFDANRHITRESGGTNDGLHKHETTYSPNGDITSDSVDGDHVSHKTIKNDGSTTSTDTNRKTQEVRYSEFKPSEGTTRIYMTPESYQRRAYDTQGIERMDKRVDYNHVR